MPASSHGPHAQIGSIFDRLRHALDGLVAVGLADANGLPVAFLGPAGEKNVATAMASLVVRSAQRATEALGIPPAKEVVIGSEGFTVLVWPVQDGFTLVVILAHEANIGLARLQVDACGSEIRAVLATP